MELQLSASGQAVMDRDLTRLEIECLQLASQGKTNDAISRVLGFSEHTVNHYFVMASKKLDAVNRTHAVGIALRLKIIN